MWTWLSRQRPPLPVMVAGAEGGVGTSTVAALIGETIAAGSPGPTLVLDQCGSRWGSLARRLLGQRDGLTGEQAQSMLREGITAVQVLTAAPTTSAGAAIVTDGAGYTPTAEMFGLTYTTCGAMVIDGGSVDLTTVAQMGIGPVVVLVGRADVIGAEAICAALGFLSRHTRVQPVAVLSSPAPADRRRVQAARKLVATAGVAHVVSLPYDAHLMATKPLRLDQVGRTTAAACLRMVNGIGQTQEVLGYVR